MLICTVIPHRLQKGVVDATATVPAPLLAVRYEIGRTVVYKTEDTCKIMESAFSNGDMKYCVFIFSWFIVGD